ncbi:MAG TPA: hypothetical protein VIH31_01735 [Candidatus Paceibacterota bacterium]
MITSVIKIFLPAAIAFIVGILITPLVTNFLYKYKFWKKTSVNKALGGGEALITKSIHNDDTRKTPRMGGIVVWASVFITTLLIWLISKIFPGENTQKLDYLSRSQTWLPLLVFLAGSIIGLLDDYLVVSNKGSYVGGGLSLKTRLSAVFLIALIGGWWFFFKLGVSSIVIPFLGEINLGLMLIPIFIIFMIGIYSGGIIDGIDGLAGGVFSVMFASYALIAFFNQQIDLAALCLVIVGGLLAFLWFNIPPARFFLSETGTMALTMTLVVIAFLTRSVGILPIIAFPLIATSLSSLIQILSKKTTGRKVFTVAPLHNHFQAKGWPGYKVTMRYWIMSMFFGVLGIIIFLIGQVN